MSEKDPRSSEVGETLKVFSLPFVANHETPEVEEPGEESLILPSPGVARQRSSVLFGAVQPDRL